MREWIVMAREAGLPAARLRIVGDIWLFCGPSNQFLRGHRLTDLLRRPRRGVLDQVLRLPQEIIEVPDACTLRCLEAGNRRLSVAPERPEATSCRSTYLEVRILQHAEQNRNREPGGVRAYAGPPGEISDGLQASLSTG